MGTLTPDWMLMKEPRGGRAAGGGAGSALSQVRPLRPSWPLRLGPGRRMCL